MLLLLSLLGGFAVAQQLSPATPPRGTQVDAVPILGIGTVQLKGNTTEVIAQAIVNGYRHIDCAWGYGNQKDIGFGIREGLKRANLKREDLWITSKLWNTRSVLLNYGITPKLTRWIDMAERILEYVRVWSSFNWSIWIYSSCIGRWETQQELQDLTTKRSVSIFTI
jgi:hypothetical protein